MPPNKNAKCPCGSGRKYKSCCAKRRRGTRDAPYTGQDRCRAQELLEALNEELEAHEEMDLAFEDFAPDQVLEDDFPGEHFDLIEELFGDWVMFDRPWQDGPPPVQQAMDQREARGGPRLWLEQMKRAPLGFWEVTDLFPGRSITLRELISEQEFVVREIAGSRTLHRRDLLAGRVIEQGKSGQPELEGTVVSLRQLDRQRLVEWLGEQRSRLGVVAEDGRERSPYELHAPILLAEYLATTWQHAIPELRTSTGQPMVIGETRFEILDHEALHRALRDHPELAPVEDEGEEGWTWIEPDPDDPDQGRVLGSIELKGDTLQLNTMSDERTARGRALLEGLAGPAIRFRATVHQDMQRKLQEMLAQGGPAPDAARGDALPPEVVAPLLQEQYDRHYRRWLDDAIPALDGASPRQARLDPRTRPKLVDLLHGLDNLYHRAIARGEYGYEPTWLWRELHLEDERGLGVDPAHPPPLAHELMEEQVPGLGLAARQLAARVRARPGFDDGDTATRESLREDVPLVRYLQEHAKTLVGQGEHPGDAEGSTEYLESHLHLYANHELHRRKTFWLDDGLAWALGKTRLDLPGSQLRLPFPAFAVVFTDRYTLGLAERLLARDRYCPIQGDLIRSATVYVVRERSELPCALHLGFLFDTGGDDWPYLLTRDLWIEPEEQLDALLESLPPGEEEDARDPILTAPETRSLVHQVINAILYATSAGVEPVPKGPPKPREPSAPRQARVHSGEEVFYLPGRIDITQVRRLQEVERSREGSSLMHRFMVRGHWRRPAANWKVQRPRWIEPYWKGPDLATVIEREYRLRE
jgi:hypothetical protein